MKKILTLTLIIAVPFFLTACTKQQNNSETGTKKTVGTETQKQDTAVDKKTNLLSLLKSGDAVKCTYSFESENGSMNGTVYVNGKDARSDTITKVPGEEQQDVHSVIKNNWMYIWTGQQKQGMKMEIPENENNSESNNSANLDKNEEKYKGLMEDYNYNCSPWNVDSTVFETPTDITFTDLSTMMEGFKTQIIEACQKCDEQSTEQAKTACKTALNCDQYENNN